MAEYEPTHDSKNSDDFSEKKLRRSLKVAQKSPRRESFKENDEGMTTDSIINPSSKPLDNLRTSKKSADNLKEYNDYLSERQGALPSNTPDKVSSKQEGLRQHNTLSDNPHRKSSESKGLKSSEKSRNLDSVSRETTQSKTPDSIKANNLQLQNTSQRSTLLNNSSKNDHVTSESLKYETEIDKILDSPMSLGKSRPVSPGKSRPMSPEKSRREKDREKPSLGGRSRRKSPDDLSGRSIDKSELGEVSHKLSRSADKHSEKKAKQKVYEFGTSFDDEESPTRSRSRTPEKYPSQSHTVEKDVDKISQSSPLHKSSNNTDINTEKRLRRQNHLLKTLSAEIDKDNDNDDDSALGDKETVKASLESRLQSSKSPDHGKLSSGNKNVKSPDYFDELKNRLSERKTVVSSLDNLLDEDFISLDGRRSNLMSTPKRSAKEEKSKSPGLRATEKLDGDIDALVGLGDKKRTKEKIDADMDALMGLGDKKISKDKDKDKTSEDKKNKKSPRKKSDSASNTDEENSLKNKQKDTSPLLKKKQKDTSPFLKKKDKSKFCIKTEEIEEELKEDTALHVKEEEVTVTVDDIFESNSSPKRRLQRQPKVSKEVVPEGAENTSTVSGHDEKKTEKRRKKKIDELDTAVTKLKLSEDIEVEEVETVKEKETITPRSHRRTLSEGDNTSNLISSPKKAKSKLNKSSSSHRKLTPTLNESTLSVPGSSAELKEYVYHQWLQRKKLQTKQEIKASMLAKKKAQKDAEEEANERRTINLKTFEAWNDSKTEDLQGEKKTKHKMKLTEKEKLEETLQRKKDAEKYFESWKKEKDEQLKKQYSLKKKEEKQKDKEQFNFKRQTSEEALKAFETWKGQKTKDLAEKKKRESEEKAKSGEEKVMAFEKKQEALRVYDNWKNSTKRSPRNPSPQLTQSSWLPAGRNLNSSIPDRVQPVIVRRRNVSR